METAGDRDQRIGSTTRYVLRAVHDKFGIEGLRKIKSGTWQVESLLAGGMVRSCYCATLGTLMVADSDSVNEFCSAVCAIQAEPDQE